MRWDGNVLLAVLCAIAVLIVVSLIFSGCVVKQDPVSGDDYWRLDPKLVTRGDEMVAAGEQTIEASRGLLPDAWWMPLSGLVGILAGVWNGVKNIQITKGAKIAKTVIDNNLRNDAEVWATVRPQLIAGVDATTGLKPIMPDKL